ncbi:MAG: indolepyruvate oxidoreductase subunit beta [Dehalococcoidia bacterium]|jgi:indolepyruvate ferredoxin oxidoreductase beta subunit|nr:indolepyruvate oxidoreductase subunit beta [Dehalococcoidia bacterium]
MKELSREPLNLIIGGVGGQGNVLMAQLVGQALVQRGYTASVGDTYGVSQRGGPVASHVRVSHDRSYGPLIPAGQADVILTLEPAEALRLLSELGNPSTVVVTNSRPVYPPDVSSGRATYPATKDLFGALKRYSSRCMVVDASAAALAMGDPIFTNIVMLGVLVGADVAPLERKDMADVLADRFKGTVLERNLAALDRGIALAREAR